MRFNYVFYHTTGQVKEEPKIRLDLTKESIENLYRYSAKLFYDQNVKPDYDKVIREAVAEYLKNHFTEKEEEEFKKMKADELEEIEKENQKIKPKFDWDKGGK